MSHGRPQTARTTKNVESVETFVLSLEDRPGIIELKYPEELVFHEGNDVITFSE